MKNKLEQILKESPFNQHTEEFLIKLEDMNEITKIVQELEELNRILSSDKSMFIEELVREQQQNKRYKQALEEIVSFDDFVDSLDYADNILRIAFKALEESE